MYITADAILLFSDNQCNLAVGLQADQTIDNMTARFFQLSRPNDVVFLIETRL